MSKQKFDIRITFHKPISKLTIRDLIELTRRDFIDFNYSSDSETDYQHAVVFLVYPDKFCNTFSDLYICTVVMKGHIDRCNIIKHSKKVIIENLMKVGFMFTNDKDTTLSTLISKVQTIMGQFYEG